MLIRQQRCAAPEHILEPLELAGERDLGWMLLDLDYSDKENIKPVFFRAKLVDGVLTVPAMDSAEVTG